MLLISAVGREQLRATAQSSCVHTSSNFDMPHPVANGRCRESFLAHVSMTSEQGGRNSDAFLTGMHLAVITGDRFCADFAHLKQAYCVHS